jgi:hypothetical protein
VDGRQLAHARRGAADRGECREAAGIGAEGEAAAAARPILQTGKMLQNSCIFLDWTNWTFWVTALALVAFGFNLRVIYEQWRSRKTRKKGPDEVREIRDLRQRLEITTERLNKANADAASKSD